MAGRARLRRPQERRKAGGVIEDLGSKNGTVVNGVRISAPTVLSDGDAIDIAGTRLVFRISGRSIATKTAASP